MKPKTCVEDDSPLRKKTEQRAYELYELGGGEHGHDVEHWLHAGGKFLRRPRPALSDRKLKRQKTPRMPHDAHKTKLPIVGE